MLSIKKIESDNDIELCFNVLVQLRLDMIKSDFLHAIHQQMEEGYRLVAVLLDEQVAAVAGYRISKNLAWGKYLYVEDFITDQQHRSSGLGKSLLSWLHIEAKNNGCSQLHLDSGSQRLNAHRFYERENMTFASHHYVSQL